MSALLPATPLRAAVVEEIVAKVNNRIITRSEMQERTEALVRQMQQQYSGPELEEELRASQDGLLANLITENLLLERAENIFDMERIKVSLIEDFRKQQNIANEAELETALKEQRVTRQELETQLIRMTVPNEIINYDVKRRISVSETELKDYYDAHASRWETPASVTVREIVLLHGDAERGPVLERARKLAEEARGGADFVALVERDSEAGTRESQGLLGPLAIGDLLPAIAEVVADLKPGEISNPIDTGRSFHIVRLEARTEKVVKPLTEVREEVYNLVREQKFRPRFDVYLKRLWKDNYIEIAPKYESLLVVSPLKPHP